MLVTSTLVFFGLATRSAIDVVLLLVKRNTMSAAWRVNARHRLQFLAWYAIALVVIYGIYLASMHR